MPAFVTWMMGLPEGWVDGPARTHQLRMLGNAVVPHQAALAMRLLTSPNKGMNQSQSDPYFVSER